MSTPADHEPAPPDSNPLVAGQIVGGGRYVLKKILGQGGMGVVWLAQDKRLREPVALKFLPPQIAFDPAALEDLRRETWRSRKLSHPNIVRIHDLHEGEGERPFITMEYVDGPNLHYLRASKPGRVLSWKFLAPILRQLCAALEYAHEEKVVHRDLKPANLMLDSNGRLKLADFGLACVVHDSITRLTGHPTAGTLDYMSPQQADGKKAQISDDIYALGASLYDLLTSKPPFHSGDVPYQLRNTRPDPMVQRLADLELTNEIPSEVAALVMACLAKDPEQRPPNARAIIDWLDSAANASPVPPFWAPIPPVAPPIVPSPLPVLLPLVEVASDLPEPAPSSWDTTSLLVPTTEPEPTNAVPPVIAPSSTTAPSPAGREARASKPVLIAAAAIAGAAAAFTIGVVAFLLSNRSHNTSPTPVAQPTVTAPVVTAPPAAPTKPSSTVPAPAPVARPAPVQAGNESTSPHQGRVRAVAFSPNGFIVASGGDDALVRLWLPYHRRTLPPLLGHNESVLSVAFSPRDSRRLISGGRDGMLKSWDASTGASLWTRTESGAPFNAVLFSADGQTVFCGTGGGMIQFRDAESGALLRQFAAHALTVNCLALSPDGKLLVSAGGDASIRLWNAQSGALLKTFDRLTTNMTCLSFSPDERTLAAAGGEDRYHVFDLPLGILKRSSPAFNTTVNALVFQPDGDWLVVNGDGRTSGFQLSAADGSLRSYVFPNGTSNITTLAAGPDGLRVYGTAQGRVGHSQGGVLGASSTADPFASPDPARMVKRTRPVEPSAVVPTPAGWVRLLDGKTLQGWEMIGNGQWKVQADGSVTSRGNPGALLTTAQYENFELKADVKFAYGGVAALGFRLRPGVAEGDGGFGTQAFNDLPPGISRAPVLAKLGMIHNHIVPHDTWATLRVVANGKKFQTYLNDKMTVNMSPAAEPSARGQVALLHYVSGVTVSYRNVMIHPLGTVPANP